MLVVKVHVQGIPPPLSFRVSAKSEGKNQVGWKITAYPKTTYTNDKGATWLVANADGWVEVHLDITQWKRGAGNQSRTLTVTLARPDHGPPEYAVGSAFAKDGKFDYPPGAGQ